MKILIGMTRADTMVSGSFKHVTQIGQAFQNNGAEVVYLLGGNGVAADKLRNEGFNVHSILSLKRELSPLSDIWALLMMIWLILKERPDVCSWHTAKIGALGRIASFITMRKSYYVPHGVPFVNTPENKGYKKYEFIERMLAFLPSKIIGVCNFDRNEYLRIGVNGNRLLVIPNGMQGIEKFDDINATDDSVIKFITAARFEAQKDYRTLAKACHRLITEGLSFELDVYGDGFMEEEIKDLFLDLPTGTVSFKGVVNDFATRLACADVFILSSFWEGLPRSIIEAMACRKPIIASDVGGCSELITNAESGFLIPIRNDAAMYEAMKNYIQKPEDIKSHGLVSLQQYKSGYTLEVMQEAYCREYGVLKAGQKYVS
jgi:glycosyltransferase involved in cell wall biosynthesis